MDYCNAPFYGLPQSSISKLQRIQNAGRKILDHIPVLGSLHWLCVDKKIDFKVLLLVNRVLHHQAAEYMRAMLQERTNVRTVRSTVSSRLAVPRSRLKGFGNCTFSIAAPRMWKALQ